MRVRDTTPSVRDRPRARSREAQNAAHPRVRSCRLLRITTSLFLASLAAVSALVAATDYWIPVSVSLASFALSAWLALPLWRSGRHRVLIALIGVPLTALSIDTLARLIHLATSR